MKDPAGGDGGPGIPASGALSELREGLREAARRDVEARHVRRRRRRRATGAIALALLGGAAAATATDLISVGEPVSDPVGQTAAYRAAGDRPVQIAVTAESGDELRFAVGIYTAANGESCMLAGHLRGTELGELRGGTFHPYANGRTGACRAPGLPVVDQVRRGSRVLVYGRAPRAARRVRVVRTGATARPGLGGAFLFVFDKVPTGIALKVEFGE